MAIVVRLAFVLLYPQVAPTIGDDRMYDQVGWNIASGKGFSGGFAGQTDRPGRPAPFDIPGSPEIGIGPIYPAFLAAIYVVAGHDVTAARVVQACLGGVLVLLVYLLTVQAFGVRVAQVAAFGTALYPALIIYTGPLLTESLTFALLPLALWATDRAARTGSSWWWAAAGIAGGVAVLEREELLLLLPVLLAAAWWLAPTRLRLAQATAFVLAAALTIGVWTARNYVTFRRLVLVSAHGGDTLWLSAKGWDEWHYDDPELQRLTAGLNYLQQNDVFRREGIKLIEGDPLRYARLCIGRLPDFWISSQTAHLIGFDGSFGALRARGQYGRVAVKLLLLALNCGVIAIGLFGAVRAVHARANAWSVVLLLAPVVVVGGVHFLLYASPRYQLPILPFVIVFAAAAVAGGHEPTARAQPDVVGR